MRSYPFRVLLLLVLIPGALLWSSYRSGTVAATALAPDARPAAPAAPSGGGPYCSTGVLSIPDNDPAGVTSTINVADSATITDLNVSLDVTHTWVGDLRFTLSHGATTAELYDRPGVPGSTFGCSGDDFNTTTDDEAATSYETACVDDIPAFPAGGSFIPGDPPGPNLAAFDGQNINGVWTLTASDEASGDEGSVNQWCLITDGGTGPTPTPSVTPSPTITRTPTNTPTPTATPNAPDIAVNPASVNETHNTPPQTTNRTLELENTGSAALTWTISEDGSLTPPDSVAPSKTDATTAPIVVEGACDAPSDIPWLTVNPTNGTTPPGGSSNVTVTLNSTGLSGGPHTGTLCVESNDPDEPVVAVPVTLNVNLPTAVEVGTFTESRGGLPLAEITAAGLVLLAGGVMWWRRR